MPRPRRQQDRESGTPRGGTVTVALSKPLHRRLAHMAIDREMALGTLLDRAVKRYVDAWEEKHRPSHHREMAQGED
jgi:predicted HicB family RNase H-like nuclease